MVGEISHVIGDESGIDSNDYSRFDEIQQFSILKSQELVAEWHYEQRARVLITDDSGAVVGVYAENEDGTYTRYNAKTGVILCTGDFGGNVEMSWALLAEIAECAARAGKGPENIRAESMCEGDGHKMAARSTRFRAPSSTTTGQAPRGARCPISGSTARASAS